LTTPDGNLMGELYRDDAEHMAGKMDRDFVLCAAYIEKSYEERRTGC
jgi:hypothetical protein